MTEEQKPKSHIGDALAHAMVPPTEAMEEAPPKAKAAPAKSAIAQDEAAEEVRMVSAGPEDPRAVESGEMVQTLERFWPLIWLAMLTVVCVIGIYNAVSKLPNAPNFF